MAATGFTPIQLYRTSTASAIPTAGNLADGELAINLTDERLYFKNASGVVKLLASNSGALGDVTLNGAQTLTNKRITPRVVSIADAATITPTGDTADQYVVTALAQSATIAAPSGTPTDGQKLTIRIEDNGTGRALTWTTTSGAYRAIGTTLPTTTVAGKTIYVGCIYNSQDTFWDVVAVAQQA